MSADKDRINSIVLWVVNAVLIAAFIAAAALTSRGVIAWREGEPFPVYGLSYDVSDGELDLSRMSAEEALEKAEDAAKVRGATP